MAEMGGDVEGAGEDDAGEVGGPYGSGDLG